MYAIYQLPFVSVAASGYSDLVLKYSGPIAQSVQAQQLCFYQGFEQNYLHSLIEITVLRCFSNSHHISTAAQIHYGGR